MLVHENALVKIRDDMPLDRAALIGCGVTTGVGAVFNTAKVEPGLDRRGDRLRRHRAQLRSRARRIAGAGRVIAVDMRRRRSSSWPKQFGATDVVDASSGDPVGAGAAS